MTAASIDKRDMLLAFGHSTCLAIVKSDGSTKPAELARISKFFPGTKLAERGLFAQGQPTERYHQANRAALSELGALMDETEKLMLAQRFFDLCGADDSIEQEEIKTVIGAMQALGVSRQRLTAYMRERTGARRP